MTFFSFLNDAWTYKLSLLPVLVTFLIFEIPALVRRFFRILYTPVYFIFFPMGHSDQLYAQYFNEDDFYGVGESQTEEEKKAVRVRIVAISVISMIFSTVLAPLLCGFISAFYLTPTQFVEFVWFLLAVKFTTVSYSLYKLRDVSFIYKSGSFYFVLLLYALYFLVIWRLVFVSHAWAASHLATEGAVSTLIGLLDVIVQELFLYVVIVGAATWAITYFYTNPIYIPKPPTVLEPDDTGAENINAIE